MKIQAPYYPIIYVRGYAMTQGEISDTVATPYMGFNLGATKTRQDWQGQVRKYIFESPLVRLMKDYGYRDNYAQGKVVNGKLPAKSILIHRYYDEADEDLGSGRTPSIEEAAEQLRQLIRNTRDQVCGADAEARADFKVYLVAHSMGGLVVRCLLQNDRFDDAEERQWVDKVFTYATPHNGIDLVGKNVPGWLGLWDINNFNRDRIARYLCLEGAPDKVNSLNGKFDPQRFFCLIGTNHRDYDVASGVARTLAGEMSDGLVRIKSAAVRGAPRAFVYRSHSGHYGIVNSEEGYQNLVRFLFGNLRVYAWLEPEVIPLPPEVEKIRQQDGEVRASYYFESTVTPRGGLTYKLDEKRKETYSAILRKYDELFPQPGESPRQPVLLSLFLDSSKARIGGEMMFTIELAVSSTGYEVDGFLWMEREIPGETLFRDTLFVRADRKREGWALFYNLDSRGWAEDRFRRVPQDNRGYYIPIESQKGFRAALRLDISPWNHDPG